MFSRFLIKGDPMSLIVLEGIDGSGKQTQSAELQTLLAKIHPAVHVESYPQYGSFYGRLILEYLHGDFGDVHTIHPKLSSVLYALDRLATKSRLVERSTNTSICILDRYVTSNLAYQVARLPRTNEGLLDLEEAHRFKEWLFELEFVQNGLPYPNICIFLDVPWEFTVSVMNKRLQLEDTDHYEQDFLFLKDVRSIYCDYFPIWFPWFKVIQCYHEVDQQMFDKSVITDMIMATLILEKLI